MKYRLLGRSGLKVSELCLGTMGFGTEAGWGADKDTSFRIMEAFAGAGGNFLDTANVYTNGTSERLLGEFLHGQRERIVLATKYTNAAPGTDPNAAGNQRKSMFPAILVIAANKNNVGLAAGSGQTSGQSEWKNSSGKHHCPILP